MHDCVSACCLLSLGPPFLTTGTLHLSHDRSCQTRCRTLTEWVLHGHPSGGLYRGKELREWIKIRWGTGGSIYRGWDACQVSGSGGLIEDYILGEMIVSKYVAESITMIAGHFGHEGLCQLRTELRNCSVRHVI